MTSASLTLYLYRVIFSGPGRGSGVRIAVTCVSAHLRLQHRCVWWRLPGQLLFHHLSSTLPAVAFDGIHDSGQLFGPGFARLDTHDGMPCWWIRTCWTPSVVWATLRIQSTVIGRERASAYSNWV